MTGRSLFGCALTGACAALLWSCGGGTPAARTPAQAFAEAKHLVANHDWLEAETMLNGMRYQFAGSAVADSVEFLLGACYFQEGKFLLAAYEYGSLRHLFPTSPLNQAAQFAIAESYDQLAPPSGIDQEYTTKAIDEYQVFLEQFGRRAEADSLATRATARIHELRDRLAKKSFDAATLYYNMNRFRASAEYCDLVQEQYYDSPYADRAGLMKIRCLINLHQYNEAERQIDRFLGVYRTSELVPDVRALRESISDKVTAHQ